MPHSRVLVVTSCTGEKRSKPKHQLTLEDFREPARLKEREGELAEFACPAVQMYAGQQHLLAMEGVELLRQSGAASSVDVAILSAGYGLIPEERVIVPYEVTFSAMKMREVDEWAQFLGVREAFERAIADYDLVFLLLGKNYLRAAFGSPRSGSLSLPVETLPNQTLIFLASACSATHIKSLTAKTFVLPLSNVEAKRYRCGLVGLKGFLFKQFAQIMLSKPEFLEKVYHSPESFKQLIDTEPIQLKLLLELPEAQLSSQSVNTSTPLGVDAERLVLSAVEVSRSVKKQRKKASVPRFPGGKSEDAELIPIPELPPAPNLSLGMKYFIPEWDDRIDPGYDFLNDTLTPGRDPYEDDDYAHEIYSPPNYDGILVSKVVVESSKKKRSQIEAGGIHQFIRFQGNVMGDCGAFGYIKEDVPPYTTEEILEYYQHLGFDFGVSIDHLIVGPFAEPGVREKRYELTRKNAENFIQKHKKGGYTFTPIGAVQGWDSQSYAKAAKAYIDMGYEYIALGGLARAKIEDILETLESIHPHLTPTTRMHLFGVGRLNAIPAFRHLGVTSFDSASPLRKAWLDPAVNYHSLSGQTYTAVRIPKADGTGVRIKRLLEAGVSDRETLKQLEEKAIQALREFDAGRLSLELTLESLLAYDGLLELPKDGKVNPQASARRVNRHAKMYEKLLADKPWKFCDCPICKEIGIEVIIFRGNDRNRRRGFHNTYVFYKRFQGLLNES